MAVTATRSNSVALSNQAIGAIIAISTNLTHVLAASALSSRFRNNSLTGSIGSRMVFMVQQAP